MIRWKQMSVLAAGALAIAAAAAWLSAPYWIGRGAATAAEHALASTSTARLSFLQLEGGAGKSKVKGPVKKVVRNQWPVVREVPIDDARDEVRSILTSPGTYSGDVLACFAPEMALRYESPGRVLDVVISLSCRRIRIWDSDQERDGDWFLSRRGVERLTAFYAKYARSD
jgi:hypothetical protein